MEDQKMKTEERAQEENMWSANDKNERRGKIMGGLLIVAIGSLFLARELGVQIPFWIFSWKMLLIGLGLITAVKHKFMHAGWVVLVGVGGAFLLCDIYPDMQIKPILWPSLIIMAGLIVIFKPRRKSFGRYRKHWKKMHDHHHNYNHRCEEFYNREEPSKEDFIDSVAFMAGVKKNILSKTFKGGDITNIFGGSELNLSQADFEGKANLEITQVFGGTKLVVPAHWEIKSELVTIFGNVEDKRAVQPSVGTEPTKVLVLTGTTVFGGIEIRSF